MAKEPNDLCYGHHGTSTRYVDQILENGLPVTTFKGDWIGPGRYFWENDRIRALEWSRERVVPKHGGEPAVIEAVIDLSACLDLTRRGDLMLLRSVAESYWKQATKEQRAKLAHSQSYYSRSLDSFAIKMLTSANMHPSTGKPLWTSVRAAFGEGDLIWSMVSGISHGIRTHDHIQINILSESAILRMYRVI